MDNKLIRIKKEISDYKEHICELKRGAVNV